MSHEHPNVSSSIASSSRAFTSAAGLSQAALNSLNTRIAILDSNGTIVAVNDIWSEFDRKHGPSLPRDGVGASYFQKDRDGDRQDLVRGVWEVISGARDAFEAEYSFISQGRQIWFHVSAIAIKNDRDRHVVVSHEDITGRALAEQSWQAAERRYKALLSHVPGTVYMTQPDDLGKVVFWSFSRGPTLGVPEATWRREPDLWKGLLHPEDREMLDENDRWAVETGEPFSVEYRYIEPGGNTVWVQDTATLIRDESGKPLHWLGIALDITDHKNIELALKASQEQFRSAFEDASIAMAIFSLDDAYVKVNRPYCELFGLTEEQFMISQGEGFIHPDDLQEARKQRNALLNGEIPRIQAERRLVRADGSTIHALLGVSLIHDAEGTSFLLSQVQDITERKQTEMRLRDATETLESVFRASPVAIVVTDLNNDVIDWNPMAEELFGWSATEAIGHQGPMIQLDAIDQATEIRSRVLTGEVIRDIEVQRQHKDGRLLDLSLSGAPIRAADGSVSGAMALYVDLREQKSAEAARATRDRVLGMVAGTAGLDDVLNAVCELVEAEISGALASVLLLDDSREHLFHRGSASLPAQFVEAMDGSRIGPDAGSCGTAALLGKPVIVSDIEHDPLWADYGDLALQYDLRSCWSVPILSSEGVPLGSFGVFTKTVRHPTEQELEVLLGASHLAYIAIERKLAEERVRESEELFRRAFESAATGLAFVSFEGVFLGVNPALSDMVGYTEDELVGRNYRDITHPDDVEVSEVTGDAVKSGDSRSAEFEKRYIHRDGHIVWVRMNTSMIHDAEGRPLYHITQINDVTPRKQAEDAVRQSEEQFRGLIQHVSDMIGIVDKDLTIVYESPAIEASLGYKPEDVVGENAGAILHPDELESITQFAAELMEHPGMHLPLLFRGRHADGSWRWLEATVTNLLHVPGIEGFVINARDVTDRRRAEQAIRESEERFRSAFDDASVAMAILSLDDVFLRVNDALCELSGYDEHEIIGKRSIEMSHPDDAGYAVPQMTQVLRGEIKSFQMERRYLHRDGSTIWALVNISAALDSEGYPMHLLAQIQDITERKLLEQNLQHQAFHDALTGLPNRALLLERLRASLNLHDEIDGTLGLLFLDLDNFKVVNDSLGHVAGDELLIQVSRRLSLGVAQSDTVARLGGDEFAVLVHNLAGHEEGVTVARRLVTSFEEPFVVQGRQISTSASIGVVIAGGRDTPDDLLRQADVAMYRAKSRGRNRIELFDSDMQADALLRLELEHDLRNAISERQFEVYYQPTIDLDKRTVSGVEALVRWNHPVRGIIAPDAFIPLAEETGLILQIGRMVLRRACHDAHNWIDAGVLGTDAMISVNLSARQFVQPDLVSQITTILDESGLNPSQLVLEMTETVLMDDIEGAAQRLDALSGLGVRIAIDDFGTGYSSLSYLRRFPVDLLKIDRSFVFRLETSTADAAIVTAIVSLATSLGIKSIGEGVETVEQLDGLMRLGCHGAQGYLFSRPVPAAELEVALTACLAPLEPHA